MGSMARLSFPIILYGVATVTAQIGAPPQFTAKEVGPGGSNFKDSPHFRIHGANSENDASIAIKMLEAAYECYVVDLGWRSSGLSFNPGSDSGPWYKENVYAMASAGAGAAGVMKTDPRSGLSYLQVGKSYLSTPKVTVHEYGHALTYHERTWVEQTNTGAWWECQANWFADTYMTSPLCAKARAKYNQPEGKTIIELHKVIGSSHQVILDGSQNTGNYYQAWPFLTYCTNNPDNYPGLGKDTMREMFRKYKKGSNETPLHALERVAAGTKLQKIVGRYWARMAYVDIGHKQANQVFQTLRPKLNYQNLDSVGAGSYKPKASRQPRYFGSNIIPLKGTGAIGVKITANSPFTATLAVKGEGGKVKYVDLPGGSGQTNVEKGEEATLVVVNTPDKLIQYNGFKLPGSPASVGLDYQLTLTGATA
jgi:hypothetical protein